MRESFSFAVLLFLLLGTPQAAQSQQRVHVGPGIIPGIGAQVAYVQSGRIFTMEGVAYADFAPSLLGDGESTLATAIGFGGSIRILDVLEEFGRSPFPGYHVDAGLRLGPSLRFLLDNQTAATRNTRFSLFFEPFLRASAPFGPRIFFLELGTQRPLLRGGVILSF